MLTRINIANYFSYCAGSSVQHRNQLRLASNQVNWSQYSMNVLVITRVSQYTQSVFVQSNQVTGHLCAGNY